MYVCTCPGLDLIAHTRFVSEPVSNDIQTLYRIFLAFSDHYVFHTGEVIRSRSYLMPVTQLGYENKSLRFDFLGIFVAVASQKQLEVTPYELGIRHLCTVPQTHE
jgi:hypothetical protein